MDNRVALIAEGSRTQLTRLTGRISRSYVAIVLLTAALAVILAGRISYKRAEFADWDLHWYRAMAAASPGINADVPVPYASRLLGPYVAGLLPLPTDLAFFSLNSIAAVALAVLTYDFLIFIGIRDSVAAFTTVLFLLNRYAFQMLAWDYFQMDDTLTLVFLVLLFKSLLRGKKLQFALWLALGAATRETALLMVPIALFHYPTHEEQERRRAARWLLACLPGVVIFVLLRTLVPAQENGIVYYWNSLVLSAKFWTSPEVLFRRLVWVWAPFSFVPLVLPRETMTFVKRNMSLSLLYPLVLLSTTFGGGYSGNNERLVVPAFLTFYALLATVIEQRIPTDAGRMALLLLAALLCATHHLYGLVPLPSKISTLLLSLAGIAIATGTAVYCKVRRWGLTDQSARSNSCNPSVRADG